MRINPLPHSSTSLYSKLNLPEKGQGTELLSNNNSSISIVVHSPLFVDQAIQVVERFQKENIEINLLVASWLSQLDKEWWNNKLKNSKEIFIFEIGFIQGGWAEFFISELNSLNKNIHVHGLRDDPPSGQAQEILDDVGFSTNKIYDQISSNIKKI